MTMKSSYGTLNMDEEIIVVNLNSSSDNNNSDSYSTSQISTFEDIDYDSSEPPKSLLKWYHYLSDEYKNNGRFWGSKSECNERDVKPSWKDIEKAKACMLAKAQASEASSKAKIAQMTAKGVSSKGPSIASIPKEGPLIARLSKEPIPKELFACYGYDIVKDNLPVIEKPILKVIFKSPIPIQRYVLGLANVETWDNIVKKYGMRTPGRCADKSKGKRKLYVNVAFAHCIFELHDAHCHWHCICSLNLQASICTMAFDWPLHLICQLTFAMQKAFAHCPCTFAFCS
ncbi:hypothetical protein Tco_0825834 [Tanacetum coccineum]